MEPDAAPATFANMEMDVVLRTVLRHFTIGTTTASGEVARPRCARTARKRLPVGFTGLRKPVAAASSRAG